jgi:hypothetical protein
MKITPKACGTILNKDMESPRPSAPPTGRIVRQGLLSEHETREGKQATEDWDLCMRGFAEGLEAGKASKEVRR